MLRSTTILGWFVLTLLTAPSLSEARCLDYAPTVVTLVGKVSTKQVAGPPGYHSLRQGDLPETIVLLHLDKPICVKGNPDSSTNVKTHRNITEVQLIVPVANVSDRLGVPLRIAGQLNSARSGHHRTPVVLNVESMRGG